jgi:tetratricopeptide (TPR) repeat protein
MGSAADREQAGSITGLRLVALIAIALVSLWLSLAVTTGLVYAPRDPAVSVPGWHSATAEAEAAVALLQQGQQASDLDRVSVMADRALRRDPLNVVAARALGAVAAFREQQDTARRWLEYAQWLSRRDLPTQLWLIEDAVAQGNIDLALRHYNIALNTNRSSESVLFPILIAASADSQVAKPLASLVQKRPLWWERFIDALISNSTSPAGLVTLMEAAHLDIDRANEQQLAFRTIQRLFQINAEPEAFAFYQRVSGSGQVTVRNGSFENGNPLPPFDWELTDQPDLSAGITVGPDKQHPRALRLTSSNGKGGKAAHQMLHLRPGRYLLSALVGAEQSDILQRPRIRVSCRGGHPGWLVDLPFSAPGGEKGTSITQPFSVPETGCTFQDMQVFIPGSIDGGTAEAWITAVTVHSL